jgi:TonB family protein
MKLLLLVACNLCLLTVNLRGQSVDHPLTTMDGLTAPKLIKSVDPKYPRPFFGKAHDSHVKVGLVIDEEGVPQKLSIVESGGDEFDKNALVAVSKYRFLRAMRDGQPVALLLHVDVTFKVK